MTDPVGMRWRVTRAVRASSLPAPSKLIMLTLADIADAGTAEIPARFTPSLSQLAIETSLDRSTVKRHLAALDEAKWLERERPGTAEALGRGERTKYRLLIPRGSEPLPQAHTAPTLGAENAYLGAQCATEDRSVPYQEQISKTPTESLASEDPKDDQPADDPPVVDDPVDERPEVEALCKLLADSIEANGSKRPNITERWRTAARLMIDKDGREPAKIERAIAWATSHPFWSANIMSMPKLREKYDTLRLQAQREGARPAQAKSFKQQDEERAAADAQARQERYQQAAVILEELVKQGKVKTQEPGQHLPDIDPGTGACRECELPEGNARHTVGLTSYERHTWTGRIAREMERRQTSGDVSDNGMASRTATPYIDGEWIEQAALGGGAP